MRLLPGLVATALLLTLSTGPAAARGDLTDDLTAPGGHRVLAGPLGAVLTTQSLLEAGVVAELNRARHRAGCRAVVAVSGLRVAARRHSSLMARRLQLSHQLAGEATLARRTAVAGYTGSTLLGEVIAAGPRSPYDVVRTWLGSPPHRALLLDCRFRHVGAGVAGSSDRRRWWTVDLGRR